MPTPSEVTTAYRRQLQAIRARHLQSVLTLWQSVDYANIDGTFGPFARAAQLLVQRDRAVSQQLAAAYLRAHRAAAGVAGAPRVVPAMPAPAEQVETAVHVTGRVALKKAAAAGMTAPLALQNGLVQVSGATSRLVLDSARDTVRYSTLADDATVGWQRQTGGEACPFCRMLAGRGAVYSAETADFGAHDHCGCTAAPAYADLVGPGVQVREYAPSSRRISSADRARVREWIARHP